MGINLKSIGKTLERLGIRLEKEAKVAPKKSAKKSGKKKSKRKR